MVLFAAFHIPHQTKGPTPTSLREAERGTLWGSYWLSEATRVLGSTAAAGGGWLRVSGRENCVVRWPLQDGGPIMAAGARIPGSRPQTPL